MTVRRPMASAKRPAIKAPTAQPKRIAVDDAGIVAEHEAADGGDRHDQGDEGHVDAVVARDVGACAPRRSCHLDIPSKSPQNGSGVYS